MTTGFFWDERSFWHGGGNYAFTLPLGGLVQPLAAGGLPESPETKRRLKNLMDVTGLTAELDAKSAPAATRDDLLRIHPEHYLDQFKSLSDAGGGELGSRTPFAQGGYELSALSAGLAKAAVEQVWTGALANAYALSRPPGHHCLPDYPNGFCLMANIPIAIEAAQANHGLGRVVVLDWDVHHGNGTEAIYYDRDDVLTISIHQDGNYPLDTGGIEDRGSGAGQGYNMNIPLPAGAGDTAYHDVIDKIVRPAITAFNPDLIIVACGFDAGAIDPLARMLVTADGFGRMTQQVMDIAQDVCDGKLVLVHEGGYSEVYVPFCGHATIATLAGSAITAPDPLAANVKNRQPKGRLAEFFKAEVDIFAKQLLT